MPNLLRQEKEKNVFNLIKMSVFEVFLVIILIAALK